MDYFHKYGGPERMYLTPEIADTIIRLDNLSAIYDLISYREKMNKAGQRYAVKMKSELWIEDIHEEPISIATFEEARKVEHYGPDTIIMGGHHRIPAVVQSGATIFSPAKCRNRDFQKQYNDALK
jgi:hypothetical protein